MPRETHHHHCHCFIACATSVGYDPNPKILSLKVVLVLTRKSSADLIDAPIQFLFFCSRSMIGRYFKIKQYYGYIETLESLFDFFDRPQV